MHIAQSGNLPKFKVVFLGESAVGKSSICLRLTCDKFQNFSESTIGASFIGHKHKDAYLEIWDTAGQERYRSLTPMYYRGAHACIMVYDVSNRDTFQRLRDWITSILANKEDPLVLIIGNKMDHEHREVTAKEGQEYAEMIGAIFYETSALSGQNVVQSIDAMIEQLLLRNDKYEMKRRENLIDLEKRPIVLDKRLNSKCC